MRPPRAVLAASYFAYSLAGVFFLFWGLNLGLRELLGWGFYVWNSFLLIGGLVGSLGAWFKKFRIEIIGTPFLTSSLAVYGGYTFAQVGEASQPGIIAGLASIFLGSALLFLGKGLAIWVHKIRVADAIDRRGKRDAE
jgi:hypothetical protein